MLSPGSGAVPLAHTVRGTGEVPVVLLHGLAGERGQGLALASEPLVAQARCVAVDLRGHGETRLPESAADLTFGRLAEDVEDTVAALGLDRPVLVGVSMGAATACELLARDRMPVRGVVLVRPAWGWSPSPANLGPFPVLAGLLAELPADAVHPAYLESAELRAVAAVSPMAATVLAAQALAPEAAARRARLVALPGDAPTRPARVEVPGLVIGSPLDPAHPLELAHAVADDLGLPCVDVAARYEDHLAYEAQVPLLVADLVAACA